MIPKKNKVSNESEIKRLASLKKQKQSFKAKEQIIRDALNIVDNKRKNKIIFNDDFGEDDSKKESNEKFSLFNNEDDEDGNYVKLDEDCFNVSHKPKFQTIGGDERFKIDERFLDDDNEKSEKNKVVEEKDEFSIEREKQMEILEDVLGKPIAKRNDQNIVEKKKNRMVRYDPNEDKHRNYEIENKEEVSVSKKKRKKNNEMVIEEAPPIPVSNEVFYSVSDKFSESLKQQEEFSLLKTFGSTIPSDENEHYATEDIPKKQGKFEFTQNTRNPFKYDSSDDEEDNSPAEKSISKSTSKYVPLEQCDSFFFIPNDSRFKEAEEFFHVTPTSNESFKNIRRELKQIVRSKIRNNVRKNQPWKKKIGNKSQTK
ncbi:hypothetical protein PV327_002557 [Microctonus hyperodae]|uniref:Uncharacterized protein n=1 Tax=Microctonus hyperodae TaxID=165561 RepID=A0AA39KP77_MICHY|nr:hypothetical protein PV327_002557 [Microctonus hyperodae]